jgi:ribonuclease P protein component
MPTMIVQLAERSEVEEDKPSLPLLRVGFTASKKVGNAVKRNFARRRLRAVVDSVCASYLFSGEDMVIIARHSTVTASFSNLVRDFRNALNRLELPLL